MSAFVLGQLHSPKKPTNLVTISVEKQHLSGFRLTVKRNKVNCQISINRIHESYKSNSFLISFGILIDLN